MCYPKYAGEGNFAGEMRAQGSSEDEQQKPGGAERKNGLEMPLEDGKPGTERKDGSKRLMAIGGKTVSSAMMSIRERLLGKSFVSGTVPEQNGLTELQVSGAVAGFAKYLREQRELYYPQGRRLKDETKKDLRRFFPLALLEEVRIVALSGQRVENPHFYEKAREMGFTNLPDIAHRDSVTFLDALVFNERMTERNLFHALVHATQVRTLGIYLFADLFVRGFLRTKSYSMVPLKAQAFELDLRFAANNEASFAVEDEVFRWLMEKRF
ncbi:MAG TPA: hypothetical protein VGF19_04610 [Candidatus Acidoferrum sp.]